MPLANGATWRYSTSTKYLAHTSSKRQPPFREPKHGHLSCHKTNESSEPSALAWNRVFPAFIASTASKSLAKGEGHGQTNTEFPYAKWYQFVLYSPKNFCLYQGTQHSLNGSIGPVCRPCDHVAMARRATAAADPDLTRLTPLTPHHPSSFPSRPGTSILMDRRSEGSLTVDNYPRRQTRRGKLDGRVHTMRLRPTTTASHLNSSIRHSRPRRRMLFA